MKDIFGYEGIYAITEDGRVWSYKRQRFKKPTAESRGYLRVNLSREGSTRIHSIHRLVAEAYIPNPEGLPEVNHKDENKSNNSVGNLEWCSHKYNTNYGTRNARILKKRQKPVYCIELDRTFDSATQAAQELGFSKQTLWSHLNGYTKTCNKIHFKYAEKF